MTALYERDRARGGQVGERTHVAAFVERAREAQLTRRQGGCGRLLGVEELLDGVDIEGARE
jgi:hypothetical protein